ncbi:MAG TPA: ABC transporter permease [Candidatus Scybalocola faecipullorum]|mgnify:CR=1 FL=1|nr:ABC transporter permease [Candidatus Scybalocola faecipullorum]
MESLLPAFEGAVTQGVLWGIMVLGVYITYRILDIADLTVDGSFALGGSVCAVCVANGMNPFLALLLAMFAGVLAGFVTGFLHTVFEIPAILAGILTQIALWSINLHVMGKSNIPLLRMPTVNSQLSEATGMSLSAACLVIGIIFAAVVIIALYWFFGTEVGATIRATGNNEYMVRALGSSTKVMKLIGLMISNGLVGLSGALVCQQQRVGDIGMGTGAIVIGLAAIVIGEVLFRRMVSFWARLTAAVIGSVVYFIIRAIVLQLGMDPNDMKLISAIIVALALAVPFCMAKFKARR